MISEEEERLLRVSLERVKGIDEKLQNPSLEAQKEGMLLSRLLSQWVLFGSLAGATFLLSRYENFALSDAKLYLWWSLFLFFMSTLFAYLSIQQWATHYFRKSHYYASFHVHEMKAVRIWHKNLSADEKEAQIGKFDGEKLANRMKEFQTWAIRFQGIASSLFIAAIAVGLVGLTKLPLSSDIETNSQNEKTITNEQNSNINSRVTNSTNPTATVELEEATDKSVNEPE